MVTGYALRINTHTHMRLHTRRHTAKSWRISQWLGEKKNLKPEIKKKWMFKYQHVAPPLSLPSVRYQLYDVLTRSQRGRRGRLPLISGPCGCPGWSI